MSLSAPLNASDPNDPYLRMTNSPETLTNTCIAVVVIGTVVFAFYTAAQIAVNRAATIEARLFQPFSWLCLIGSATCGILLVKNGGAGQRAEYLALTAPEKLDYFNILTPPIEAFWFPLVTIPKLTILTLYLRIFVGTWTRRVARATQVLVVLHFITALLMFIFICWPFQNKWQNAGACPRTTDYYRYLSVPGLVTDAIIFVLPIEPMWKLQMSTRRKMSVAVVFVIGSLGIIAGVIRFIFFLRINKGEDYTYRTITPMSVTNAEGGAYFICSCLPGSRQLFVRTLDRVRTLTGSKGDGSYDSQGSRYSWYKGRIGSQSTAALRKQSGSAASRPSSVPLERRKTSSGGATDEVTLTDLEGQQMGQRYE